MANNRLYLVDTETKQYLCLAKSSGIAWEAGNIDLHQEFLQTRFYESEDKTNLIIGHENDDVFYNKWIKKGISFNTSNKWEYY